MIRTHLPGRGADGVQATSRNAINVLSADFIVILPGGPGTRSEARLAVRYGKPTISYGAVYTDLPVAADLAAVQEFLRS